VIKQKVSDTVHVFPFITLVRLCSCMLYSSLCYSSEELILKKNMYVQFWLEFNFGYTTLGGGGGHKQMYKKTALTCKLQEFYRAREVHIMYVLVQVSQLLLKRIFFK
jgi:hypothetical protein